MFRVIQDLLDHDFLDNIYAITLQVQVIDTFRRIIQIQCFRNRTVYTQIVFTIDFAAKGIENMHLNQLITLRFDFEGKLSIGWIRVNSNHPIIGNFRNSCAVVERNNDDIGV